MIELKTYSGHIRNHKALCEELCLPTNLERTQREEKILIEAYKKWGRDMGLHIYGMFAAAIFDGDKEELSRLAKEDYKELIKRVKAFHDTMERAWMTENKGYGFEIHSARLGGLCQRLDSCAKRLLSYVNGKIDKIEELEAEILPIPHVRAKKGEPIDYGHYGRIVSAGVLTMSM